MTATPNAQDTFKAMMRERVAPALRELGCKGSGQTFRLDLPGYWAQIGFQKSHGNSSREVSFTANLSVISKAEWAERRLAKPYLPECPKPNIYYMIPWQERIGSVLPEGGQDKWWRVHPGEGAAVAAEVIAAFRDHALPAMREQAARTGPTP